METVVDTLPCREFNLCAVTLCIIGEARCLGRGHSERCFQPIGAFVFGLEPGIGDARGQIQHKVPKQDVIGNKIVINGARPLR